MDLFHLPGRAGAEERSRRAGKVAAGECSAAATDRPDDAVSLLTGGIAAIGDPGLALPESSVRSPEGLTLAVQQLLGSGAKFRLSPPNTTALIAGSIVGFEIGTIILTK